MNRIKKKILYNRGKICLGIGAVVGGVLTYRYFRWDLYHAKETISKLTDDLADTDVYAFKEDTIIDILDKIPEGTYGSIQIKHF